MNEESFLKLLGKNIARIRKEKQLKQTDVAFECDMDKSNYIRIEGGRTNPTAKTLFKIAKALAVPVKDLFNL